jgi:flagellar basal-body rod modification protein FlgD
MASALSAITQVPSPGASLPSTTGSGTTGTSTDALAQKETFLKLLVAQIRNQNPLNPADGIEFVSQLAQFSELEQIMQMRSELETIRKDLENNKASAVSPQPPASGTPAQPTAQP